MRWRFKDPYWFMPFTQIAEMIKLQWGRSASRPTCRSWRGACSTGEWRPTRPRSAWRSCGAPRTSTPISSTRGTFILITYRTGGGAFDGTPVASGDHRAGRRRGALSLLDARGTPSERSSFPRPRDRADRAGERTRLVAGSAFAGPLRAGDRPRVGAGGMLNDILFGSAGPRGGRREGIVETAAKSMARQVGRQIMRRGSARSSEARGADAPGPGSDVAAPYFALSRTSSSGADHG